MRLAIVRTSNGKLDLNTYNIQEIGLGKKLLRNNFSVDFYSEFINIKDEYEYESYNGNYLTLIPIKLIAYRQITYMPGLIKKVLSKNYDIIQVHENSQLMTPLIISAAKKRGIKTILYQGMYRDYVGFGYYYQKLQEFLFLKKLRKNVDVVFSKTESAKKYLESKGFTGVKHLKVGLTFLEERTHFDIQAEVDLFKSKLNKVLLYIGVLDDRRDVEFLLRVLRMALDKEGKFSMGIMIVGRGPNLIKIKELSRELDIENNLLFINSVPNDQISYVYEACDLFLLPSHYEIYGMVVLESLYYGLPVISSPTAGPKDILTVEYLGSILDFDENRWVNKILFYLNSLYLSQEYKVSRKNYLIDNFCWEKIARQYINYIQN